MGIGNALNIFFASWMPYNAKGRLVIKEDENGFAAEHQGLQNRLYRLPDVHAFADIVRNRDEGRLLKADEFDEIRELSRRQPGSLNHFIKKGLLEGNKVFIKAPKTESTAEQKLNDFETVAVIANALNALGVTNYLGRLVLNDSFAIERNAYVVSLLEGKWQVHPDSYRRGSNPWDVYRDEGHYALLDDCPVELRPVTKMLQETGIIPFDEQGIVSDSVRLIDFDGFRLPNTAILNEVIENWHDIFKYNGLKCACEHMTTNSLVERMNA